MNSTVELDAYTLAVITNKAKSKFKSYCLEVKQYPFSRYGVQHEEVEKSFLGYKYTKHERHDVSYKEKLDKLIEGNDNYKCLMYDIITEYNEAASRSRISKTDAKFHIPFKEYKNIISIAEHGNY